MNSISSEHDVIWLDGRPLDRAVVGGKGASLSQLASLGAPVPAGFAVTTNAYRAAARLLGLPERSDAVDPRELPVIRDAIANADLPAPLTDELARGYERIERGERESVTVAVRSSATVEDSAAFSFAGLHDTVLDVSGFAALVAAVKRIWASLWTERAVSYRRQGGLGADDAAIAVVVQQMVRSDVSFVAFSADPVSGRHDRLVIDATWGLGEALVSGMVTPDHVVVDSDDAVVDYAIGEKAVMIIPGQHGVGVREVTVPRVLRSTPALDTRRVREIARTARRLAERLGYPADFEGAIAGGKMHFLQARPITTTTAISA
ncbi:MAG: PEP/pyruvate-binding domain-containing protein [Thermomicrobiales bacterium]|nr:PEP/pyruvate-binding domain-containing protein [Thermomicrobiales bacterium]